MQSENRKSPLVSVVMPSYNAEKFIVEAITSVINQTYSHWELIVVDDCSTDGTQEIVKSYIEKDSRIRLIAKKKNSGVANTRNIGINEAKGQFIALLDSDDVWEKKKLEKQIQLQQKTKAEIIYCSYDFIDEHGCSTLRPFVVPGETTYEQMLVSSVISSSTAFIESKILKEHLFKSEYYHEDYVLWMELLEIPVKAVGNIEVLAHYRQVSGSRASDKKNAAKQRWIIYRKVLRLGRMKSFKVFAQYAFHGFIKYAK